MLSVQRDPDSSGLKMFGSLMVQDHQTALNELESIADDEDVDLPETLDQRHQQLMILTGYSFDTAYIRNQILDHEQTIALFESEIINGKEQRIKDYAQKYLLHIQKHLNKADSIFAAIKQ